MSLEARLVYALQSNNRQKLESIFKKIYDSYFKLVYFCISTYINNKEDIEDILADTFLSFYNHLDNIDANKSIKYYLTTTAKNKSINFLKKKKEISLDEASLNLMTYETKPNKLLLDIKENLNSDELEILINHVLFDIPLNQIAKDNNLNFNTLKSKYHRIIKKLKSILGG